MNNLPKITAAACVVLGIAGGLIGITSGVVTGVLLTTKPEPKVTR